MFKQEYFVCKFVHIVRTDLKSIWKLPTFWYYYTYYDDSMCSHLSGYLATFDGNWVSSQIALTISYFGSFKNPKCEKNLNARSFHVSLFVKHFVNFCKCFYTISFFTVMWNVTYNTIYLTIIMFSHNT